MSRKLEEYDANKMGINPFTQSLVIPVTRVFANDRLGKYIEKVQSTRLYYSTGCIASVCSLSDKAQRLFLYILYHLDRRKDFIQINKDDYMKKNNVKSNTTYLAAIDELIRYSFIGNTMYKTVFWTNPFLFSSSDRLSMYPDRIMQKSDMTNEQ